jgi:hypothetical protein
LTVLLVISALQDITVSVALLLLLCAHLEHTQPPLAFKTFLCVGSAILECSAVVLLQRAQQVHARLGSTAQPGRLLQPRLCVLLVATARRQLHRLFLVALVPIAMQLVLRSASYVLQVILATALACPRLRSALLVAFAQLALLPQQNPVLRARIPTLLDSMTQPSAQIVLQEAIVTKLVLQPRQGFVRLSMFAFLV